MPQPISSTLIKLKYRTNLKAGFAFKSDFFSDVGIPVIRIGDVLTSGVVDSVNAKKIPENFFERHKDVAIEYGDYLMAMTGATIGKVARYRSFEPALLNQRVCRFRANQNIHAEYLWYLLNSNEYLEYVNLTAFGGAQPNISDTDLKEFTFFELDIKQQQKIATFLDRETAKIDALIQKQERLIELIQEKQHSEILFSVSRGIQGNKKFQQSTNNWLDKIPAHWSEGNLKVLSKIYSGGTPDKSTQEYWTDGTVPWLNSGSVNEFYIHSPSEYITEEAVRNSSAKWISKGSVLVALAGQGKTKGMAAQLMFDSTCNQSMCAIVTEDKLDGNYLLWWLTANYQNIRNMAGGDLRDGLNLEMIGSIKCPIPPINEQREISVYLNSFRAKNIALINKCEDSIELLKERRASLISAAVTGKIDVRELV